MNVNDKSYLRSLILTIRTYGISIRDVLLLSIGMQSNKLLLLFPTACCKNLLLRLDDNSDILEIKLNKY